MRGKESFPADTTAENINDKARSPKLRRALMGAGAVVTAAAVVSGGVAFESHKQKEEVAAAPTFEEELEVDLAAIEKVLIGGFGDPESRGILDYLSNQGMINHSERNILVRYPADLAQGELSAAVGSQVAKNAYYEAHSRGDHTIMVGFSQGTIPLARAASEIAAANGGVLPNDITVVAYGGPAGENGFWESSFGQAAEPFINFAVPTHDRLPAGSYDVASANDFWASTGQDTWAGQLAKLSALGQAHRIPAPHEPRLSWTGSDGVRYERTDVGVHPWTMVLNAQGIQVNEGFNAFFNNIVPVSNGRDPAPNPNSLQAFRGLGRGIDQSMGSSVPVFETLFTFLPHPIIQVGLDVGIKGPDLFVKGVAAGVQGVTQGPEAAQRVFNEPVPQGAEQPGPAQSVANTVQQTAETYVGQVIPGAQLPEINLPDLSNPAESLAPVTDQVQEVVDTVVDQVQEFVPEVPAPAPAVEAPVVPPNPVQEIVDQVQDAVQEFVPEAPAPAPAPIVEAPAPPPPAPEPEPVYVPPAPVQQFVEQAQEFVQQFVPPAPVFEAPAPAPVVDVVGDVFNPLQP